MDSPSDKTKAEELDTENEDQQNQEESSTSDTDQKTKDSSDPKSSEDDRSTFDAIMDVIKPESEDEDEGSSEDDKSKKSEDDKKSDDDEDEEDVSDDDFEDFSPEERAKLKKATAERFDKLKGLYRESKEKVTDLTAQLEQANERAGYYDQFVSYLDENRISQNEANQLFHIGALMKNDPAQALALITPYYNDLLHITGNILPPDLQQQVNQGYITKQHALELSRLRMSGQTQQAINEERQTYQQQREQGRQQQNVANMQTAIADWERQWSSSDPDYAKKKDRVLDRVELLLVRAQKQGNLPKTVDEAIKLANKAKVEVEADLRQQKPRKKVSTVDGGSSTQNLPEPKDTQDVIRRALNQ
jgi:hypothetical protein